MRFPDKKGHFGEFGGRYVPETLMPALLELEQAYSHFRNDREFKQEFDYYLRQYVGRPNPLYFAEKLTRRLGGAKIYLKREDLNHTGAHKVNNTIGQGLWRNGWEKSGSSPRPAPGSMAWPPPPSPHSWGWSARYSWGRRISTASP